MLCETCETARMMLCRLISLQEASTWFLPPNVLRTGIVTQSTHPFPLLTRHGSARTFTCLTRTLWDFLARQQVRCIIH